MQPTGTDNAENLLEKMWCEHQVYLKRLLMGLTRDVHLTDDLLQETYLHALAGIGGYAGGSSSAWLAQIAKRVFYAYRRQRYVRSEVCLELDDERAGEDDIGSISHLTLLQLRTAIAKLDLPLKTALIMKHYGGFTYRDIAKHQCCPVGTAKWRVSSALDRLQKALGIPRKEHGGMECSKLRGALLADYMYGLLADRTARSIRSHIEGCPSCRKEADALRTVAAALDAIEHERKSQVFYEIDTLGATTFYGSTNYRNTTDKPLDVVRFADTGIGSDRKEYLYVAVNGEPVELEVEARSEERVSYSARLSRPIEPGESRSLLVVFRDHSPRATLVNSEEQVWLFRPGLMIKDPGEVDVRVEAVRLPEGATLLSCDPRPDETFTGDTTTLIWRRVLGDWETFSLTVVYQFE